MFVRRVYKLCTVPQVYNVCCFGRTQRISKARSAQGDIGTEIARRTYLQNPTVHGMLAVSDMDIRSSWTVLIMHLDEIVVSL